MNVDLLRLPERVALSAELGESHFREFKSANHGPPNNKQPRAVRDIARDIGETLVAFANADGGELLVGVEDDGTISGVNCSEEQIARLLAAAATNVHKDTPLPPPRALRTEVGGNIVLYFSVPKGIEYVYLTSDGRCLQRRDRESIPISAESITVSRSEIVSREYDRHFVDNATVDDLNLALLKEVADQISRGMSAEKCLQHLELAEFDGVRLRLRRAALLLFAKNVSRWHPRCQVRVLRIDGTELKSGSEYNVISDREVTAGVLSLVEASWDLIRPHLTETRFSGNALFKTQIIYPEAACREALINAIAHRDYNAEGRGIEVSVFTDRLEVVSPGALLSSIRLEDLVEGVGVHQSRNALLARVLREVGYMRELGEGMRRILELMNASDLAPPELSSGKGTFGITLRHRYNYSREEKLWLDNFERLNLTREQRIVVRLGYNGHVVSPSEIWAAVGIVDTDAYRRLVESLRDLSILEDAVARDAAIRAARSQGVPRKSIPRYRIVPPAPRGSTASPEQPTLDSFAVSPDTAEYASVFVGNLSYEVLEDELMTAFARFGTVVSVSLPVDKYTSRRRPYGFVEFEKREQADLAIQESGRLLLRERLLIIQPARPRLMR